MRKHRLGIRKLCDRSAMHVNKRVRIDLKRRKAGAGADSDYRLTLGLHRMQTRKNFRTRNARHCRLTSCLPAHQAGAEQLAKFGDNRCSETRIVDVLGQANEPARTGLPHSVFESTKEFGISLRIP